MPVVLIEKQTPQVTVLTLNRPERRNALTIELLSELNAAIKIASDQPDERVIILRGAGAAFCTGLDLKEAAEQTKAHATAEMVANTLITISQTRLPRLLLSMVWRWQAAPGLCRHAILLFQHKARKSVIPRCVGDWSPD